MTPELKAKWLAALRSGNYEQGNNTLHEGNKFCCLGVLCDVAGYEWTEISSREPQIHQCVAGTNYIENPAYFDILGLSPKVHNICFCLNDGTMFGGAEAWDKLNLKDHPYTFAEIADWLEKNL